MVLFPSGNVAIQYWRSPKLRITLSLSVLMFCLFALTSTGQMRTQDERLPFYETESLVLRGTTDVPQAVEARAFYGKFDRNGDARAPYPPGQAILAAPFYWLGDLLASRLGGIPDLAETRFVVFATSLASAAASAASIGLLFLIF